VVKHIKRGFLLDVQPRSTQKGRGSQRCWIFGVPFYLWVHRLTHDYQISSGNTYEEGLVLGGQPRPYPKGSGFKSSKILRFLSTYACILCYRTIKFDVVTHVGRGVYLGVSHASHPSRAEFQRSPIFGFSCI